MTWTRTLRTVVGTSVALASVAAVTMGAVYAQQQTPQPLPPGHGGRMAWGADGPMGMMMGPFGGGPMRLRGLGQLDLSADQKAQIKGIVQAHRDELRALAKQSAEARKAIGAAVSGDADEATIRAKAGDLAKTQADMAVLGAKVRKEIFAVLTPEQQAKAKALQAKAIGRAGRIAGRAKRGSV